MQMQLKITGLTGFIPEVDDNLDGRVGNLGLAAEDIDDIVAFPHRLTDR